MLNRPEGRIAYDVQGDGPLVLLVPGMGDLRGAYRFLAPELVAAGYRVATADLRGHGESDAAFASYGDVETAGDIGALIETLGAPAVVVGNSMAAGAAVVVAADHPDLVAGLVLVGPFVRNPKTSAAVAGAFRVLMAPLWAAAVWRAYMPTLYAGRKPADFARYRAAVTASLRRRAYGRAFSQTTRQTDHSLAEARLAEVAAPALVVMGDRDPDFADPTAEASWIGEVLHARVVMVEEAGHYPQSQRPEVVAAAVIDFLSAARPRA